ncbi:hypothetical protein CBR_g17916 [Chara braunii]|uniref:Uncharacterized protein n=1 Tax=Chara braunii TaxID=69332 RepID=A0A388KW72_CHABU|nr:hypothetical protein CBR_g17916 [Chara braunii]|eukprot:GBG74203.1 hypothetical protein CBR_g17916 [Chara braunii]
MIDMWTDKYPPIGRQPTVSPIPTRPFPYSEERTRVCEWDAREAVAQIGRHCYFPPADRCSGFVDAGFVIINTHFPPYSILLPFNEPIVIPWTAVAPHWPRTLCTKCQRFDRYEAKGFHYRIRSEDEHKERATRLRPSTSDSELTSERRRDLIRKRDTRSHTSPRGDTVEVSSSGHVFCFVSQSHYLRKTSSKGAEPEPGKYVVPSVSPGAENAPPAAESGTTNGTGSATETGGNQKKDDEPTEGKGKKEQSEEGPGKGGGKRPRSRGGKRKEEKGEKGDGNEGTKGGKAAAKGEGVDGSQAQAAEKKPVDGVPDTEQSNKPSGAEEQPKGIQTQKSIVPEERILLETWKGDQEVGRCILPFGSVIRYFENGGIQILFSNGDISDRQPDSADGNGLAWVTTNRAGFRFAKHDPLPPKPPSPPPPPPVDPEGMGNEERGGMTSRGRKGSSKVRSFSNKGKKSDGQKTPRTPRKGEGDKDARSPRTPRKGARDDKGSLKGERSGRGGAATPPSRSGRRGRKTPVASLEDTAPVEEVTVIPPPPTRPPSPPRPRFRHVPKLRGVEVIDPETGVKVMTREDLIMELRSKDGMKRLVAHADGTRITSIIGRGDRENADIGEEINPVKATANADSSSSPLPAMLDPDARASPSLVDTAVPAQPEGVPVRKSSRMTESSKGVKKGEVAEESGRVNATSLPTSPGSSAVPANSNNPALASSSNSEQPSGANPNLSTQPSAANANSSPTQAVESPPIPSPPPPRDPTGPSEWSSAAWIMQKEGLPTVRGKALEGVVVDLMNGKYRVMWHETTKVIRLMFPDKAMLVCMGTRAGYISGNVQREDDETERIALAALSVTTVRSQTNTLNATARSDGNRDSTGGIRRNSFTDREGSLNTGGVYVFDLVSWILFKFINYSVLLIASRFELMSCL